MLFVWTGIIAAMTAALIVLGLRVKPLRRLLSAAAPGAGSRKELQAVFDSITDDICIIDREFRICTANMSYTRAAGFNSPSELAGKRCFEVFRGLASPCDQCPAAETFRKGEAVVRRKEILHRGTEREKHLEISAYPVFDRGRTVVRVIEFLRDMTDDVHMLDELIRSEKLAGVGVMTSGIAHEMNNALSGIAGTASNLLTMPEKFGLNEKGTNRVLSILDSATRATAVMKNLLQFSTPMREETRIMVNVRQLIKRIVSTVYIQEAPDIERHMTFDESLLPIKADLSKIELLLTNVIANAIRSVNERKILSARNHQEYRGLLLVAARLKDQDVLITVTDNGIGIPEKARPKIFDPFFSIWPEGAGTGLGLSTALRIVEEHGGRISFECLDDMTTFSILLPVDAGVKLHI